MSMSGAEIMFWKRALHKYGHISATTPVWKALYQNTIFEHGIGIASSFSGLVLNAFWKRALHIFFLCQVTKTNSMGTGFPLVISLTFPMHLLRVVHTWRNEDWMGKAVLEQLIPHTELLGNTPPPTPLTVERGANKVSIGRNRPSLSVMDNMCMGLELWRTWRVARGADI